MADTNLFAESSADHLRLVIETGQIGIWELDVSSQRAIRNSRHDKIFGYDEPLGEWTYDQFLNHVVADDRQRVDDRQQAAINHGRNWEFECRIETAKGKERWISVAGRPLRGADGNVTKLIGHVIDITRAKEREAKLALLTEELNHRVRNMLAMIGSMVQMSASKASDIASFATALEGRVGALARSHQLLISEEAASKAPSSILEAELATFPALRERTRIEASNEPILSGNTGQGMALVFHELITNAIKYGAFSNQLGSVDVSISGAKASVSVEWKERDGPKIASDIHPGFGSTLISKALGSKGQVKVEYPSHGLECKISLSKV